MGERAPSTLPLYPSEDELARAILGPRAKDWPQIAAALKPRGFPPVDPLMGGRYLPAVRAFLDRYHGVETVAPISATEAQEDWTCLERPRRPSRRPG